MSDVEVFSDECRHVSLMLFGRTAAVFCHHGVTVVFVLLAQFISSHIPVCLMQLEVAERMVVTAEMVGVFKKTIQSATQARVFAGSAANDKEEAEDAAKKANASALMHVAQEKSVRTHMLPLTISLPVSFWFSGWLD